jgi:hypothetical protein
MSSCDSLCQSYMCNFYHFHSYSGEKWSLIHEWVFLGKWASVNEGPWSAKERMFLDFFSKSIYLLGKIIFFVLQGGKGDKGEENDLQIMLVGTKHG